MGHRTHRRYVATDKRIFFYDKKTFGYNTDIFPYENVSSIEMRKGMMGHSITFCSSGNTVKMK
ncbi:PH domain-containing protein [Bacillus spongiae]|uniref:PH domain-containing protein n=1 Tax=Bacillus spongiae TaxID=2683610 RepID=A0ABU8HF71_9BACI